MATTLKIRLSEDQKARWEEAAKNADTNLSDWIRAACDAEADATTEYPGTIEAEPLVSPVVDRGELVCDTLPAYVPPVAPAPVPVAKKGKKAIRQMCVSCVRKVRVGLTLPSKCDQCG